MVKGFYTNYLHLLSTTYSSNFDMTDAENIQNCLDNVIYEPAHDKSFKMVCAPSEDSDQPGNPVWSVFTVHSCGQRRLIRLGGCPGWSESSLGAHAILLVLSRAGSYAYSNDQLHEPCQKTYRRTCAPSEDSVSACGQRKLIWLRRCADWVESSLGAHAKRYVFSCCGSPNSTYTLYELIKYAI